MVGCCRVNVFSLMIERNVGVAAKTYTLKRLDQDYLENL
jgi:restriction endonuclease Mrr